MINKKLLLLLFLGLIFACNKKVEVKREVFFLVEPFDVTNDSVLKVMLINNTEKSCFITLDTTRTYDYPDFNHKTNSSFIISPLVYTDDELVYMIGKGSVHKRIKTEKKVAESDAFYNDYTTLSNAIFLKKKSSKYIEIPFVLSYKLGVFKYYYDFEKNKKYELQLEYQMVKEITEKRIEKNKLDSVSKLGYFPYYEKIVSNKVALIVD